ncbi:hypothetical protein Rhopal_003143-T1 [Rhodotorula paludigena]|uniref:Proteophosphoglycan ppg4 n=1 Tax=Rhodotorula paludigena TaxID=86838 RepID=A0AAV5GI69_9BASI|nr:hypothetical protein Rhopal_003143-T1 [Rhodotorula paludigena]
METPLAVQRRPRLACPPDLSAWANAGLGLSTKPISRPLDVDERSVRSPSSSTVQRFPRAGSPPGSIATIKRRDCSTSNDDDRERFEAWLERSSALETFALDGDAAGRQETVDEDAVKLCHPRSNSLELDLGDLPEASFLTVETQSLPSPVSPATTLFSSASSSYFDLTWGTPSLEASRSSIASSSSEDPMLPPSPALVPLSLDPVDSLSAAPSAPRVEASAAHPLHRGKRLSMTPMSATKALPLASPAYGPPPVRKSSIVDLPLPPAEQRTDVTPLSPPLTPALGFAELPTMGLAGARSTTKRQRQA